MEGLRGFGPLSPFSLSVSEFLDVNGHGAAADLYWEH